MDTISGDETSTPQLPADGTVGAVAASTDLGARQTKVGARLGVWGLVGGFGAMTAFTLGAPISLPAAIAAMGAGLVVSGVGTLLASVGILRRRRAVPSVIRTAAITGVPLAGVLGVLGITSLTQWGPLVAFVQALTPTAGVLGGLVVLLLFVSFFLRSSGNAEEVAPAESEELNGRTHR